ncbi:hypothetical protein AOL_s00189g2 [Orbilia oligospora ATCC 24927]|uniref:Integrase catalytic domain-containing protein n=1 Tax=Arthrobotrys oligospora (strain ATCC 24927 / CBS 115.81 / DSM 1491) TaxID=756982 RepID=G1XR01_ARTOA|nr:hypothetical protein AOL_s00189g2 [Orbilia oligospora ATCC 24927]EGX44425.1 hypothetical protein AOL_s00189g2 [Orbilia oligospora ATCC 24927]
MRKHIEEYIKTCDMCCRNKPNRHKPYGTLQPHDVPCAPFEVITYDFIQGMQPSRDPLTNFIFNEILVITCKFSKTAIFIPWHEKFGTTEFQHVYLQHVFSKYGIQHKHICDRDRLFQSKYWQSVMNQTGTKLNIASKAHPQTDGASERLIQTLEIYLRCFVNYAQTNWISLLPSAEFAYNTSQHSTTKLSPYEVLRGWTPKAFLPPLRPKEVVPDAEEHMEKMKNLHSILRKDLQFSQERMAHYYDKKHLEAPLLKEGDKAYLLARNLKTKRPKKLDFQKYGPYTIKKQLGKHQYELDIPGPSRIHRTFHVSLLEPAPPGLREDPEDMEIEYDDYTEYDVEKILEGPNENNEYLVRWSLPYGPEDDSWQPEENISPELIQSYLRQPGMLAQQGNAAPKKRRGRPRKNAD